MPLWVLLPYVRLAGVNEGWILLSCEHGASVSKRGRSKPQQDCSTYCSTVDAATQESSAAGAFVLSVVP